MYSSGKNDLADLTAKEFVRALPKNSIIKELNLSI